MYIGAHDDRIVIVLDDIDEIALQISNNVCLREDQEIPKHKGL